MSISTVAARALRAIAPRAQHQARDAVVCASVATSSIPGTSRCSPSLAVARREQFAGVRHVSGKAPQLPSRFGPRAEGETNEPTPYQQQVPNDPRLNRPTDPRLNRPERGNKKRTAVRLLPRRKRYVPGEYYAPKHLNLEKMYEKKPRRRPVLLGPSAEKAKKTDLLYQLGLKPGHPSLHDDSYKNPVLLSTYVTEMGKIEGRQTTKLTRRSQREVGKAVRRARAMGLMPFMRRNSNAWIR